MTAAVCNLMFNSCETILSFFSSIAMATKENMTSQRGMLKSIQSRVNTLASILSFLWNILRWKHQAMATIEMGIMGLYSELIYNVVLEAISAEHTEMGK